MPRPRKPLERPYHGHHKRAGLPVPVPMATVEHTITLVFSDVKHRDEYMAWLDLLEDDSREDCICR